MRKGIRKFAHAFQHNEGQIGRTFFKQTNRGKKQKLKLCFLLLEREGEQRSEKFPATIK